MNNKCKKELVEKIVVEYINKIFVFYYSFDNSLVINGKRINLRNEEIKKASLDYDVSYYFNFFTAVSEYRERLKQKISQSDLSSILEVRKDELVIESRIKNINSIFSKIYQYINVKKEKGSVAINKCINDLFGLRIIVPLSKIDELYDVVTRLADANKWRCKIKNASKNEYRAVHLYLLKDNYSLPWEVQFWLAKHDKSNRDSHAKYKQAYTSWELSYSTKDLYRII